MVRPSKFDLIVLVVDLLSDRTFVKNTLKQLITHKSLLNSKDEVVLYLLHHSGGKDNYVRHVDTLSASSNYILEILDEVEEDDLKAGSLLNVLEKSLDSCTEFDKAQNCQLILISDFRNAAEEEESLKAVHLAKIIKNVLKYNVHFIVVIDRDVKFEKSCMLYTKNDFVNAMKNVEISDVGKDLGVAVSIAKDVDGIITDCNNFLNILEVFKKHGEKTPFKEPLTIGDFQFPTIASRILTPLPTCIKEQKGESSISYFTEPDHWEKPQEEVDSNNVLKVYKFHGQVVHIPNDVLNAGSYEGPRMFKIVGFVKQEQIPELYFKGGEAHIVRMENEDDKLCKTFNCLINETQIQNKYALALRAYNKNNQPKIYVLIPKTNWFLMVPLMEAVQKNLNIGKCPTSSLDDSLLAEDIVQALEKASQNPPCLHPHSEVGMAHKTLVEGILKMNLSKEQAT